MLANNHTSKNFLPALNFKVYKNELIYGGYIHALGGPCIVTTTALITNLNLSLPLLIITYLIPLMVYGFDYYRDMDKDKDTNPERVSYYKKRSQIYPFILVSYLAILTILLLLFSNWTMISFIVILTLGSLLYPLGLKNFTRKIPAFKNMFTTLIWALAGTFSVVFFYKVGPNLAYLLILLFIYMRMLPNTIFYDLKDVKNDTREKLKTIPAVFGKQKTIKLLGLMNILAFIPLFAGIYLKILPLYTIFMIFFLFYSMYYLIKTFKLGDTEIKREYYLLSDVEFILWPVILIIGKLSFLI